jgi:hypothetical protein
MLVAQKGSSQSGSMSVKESRSTAPRRIRCPWRFVAEDRDHGERRPHFREDSASAHLRPNSDPRFPQNFGALLPNRSDAGKPFECEVEWSTPDFLFEHVLHQE